MDSTKTLKLLEETMGAFAPFYQEEMRNAIAKLRLPTRWPILSLVRGVEPEKFTFDVLQTLQPFTNPDQLLENLNELQREKWLEIDDSGYRLSDKGRNAIEIVYLTAQTAIDRVAPLPDHEMETLNQLLKKLITSSLESDDPPDKRALRISRWPDQGEKFGPSVRTDQYLTDLLRFRDDAHRAAWGDIRISPQAKESLTYVWRNEANSEDDLAELLDFRGFTKKEYKDALCELATQDFVEQTLDGFMITEKGNRFRQDIENLTDQYFFGPWDCFNGKELFTLELSLKKLHKHMISIPAAPEPVS